MQDPSKPVDIKTAKGLGRFHIEAATSGVENAGLAYQAPSLLATGAHAQGVVMMSFFTNLMLSMLCIRAPSIIERMGTTKKATIFISLISIVTWMPLVFVFLFFQHANPVWFIALWIFSLVTTVMDAPLRDSWLADLLPEGIMGRYLAMRSIITGVAYLATFYAMGYILDIFGGQSLTGFSLIFVIALLASLSSLVLYFSIHAPAGTRIEKSTRFGFFDFLKESRKGKLGTFIVYVSALALTVNLAGPLFAVYMIEDLHFNYLTFTFIISSEYISRIIAAPIWGKYTDRSNNLGVLGLISYLIPVIPILWLFSSSVTYLIVVQLFSGIVWSGFDLYVQTYIYKKAPRDKRLRYIVYHRSLSTLGTALGALAGAYLLTVMVPVFGNKILGLFLLSGLCRFMVVKTVFHRLTGMTLPPLPGFERPSAAWASLMAMNPFQPGLYYRPQEWSMFTKPIEPQPHRVEEPSRHGIFYRPGDWAPFVDENPKEDTTVLENFRPEPAKLALFYQPEVWNQFATCECEPQFTGQAAPEHNRLYNKPQEWSRFIHEPNQQVNVIETVRKPLLDKPQEWARFIEKTPSKPQVRLILGRPQTLSGTYPRIAPASA